MFGEPTKPLTFPSAPNVNSGKQNRSAALDNRTPPPPPSRTLPTSRLGSGSPCPATPLPTFVVGGKGGTYESPFRSFSNRRNLGMR